MHQVISLIARLLMQAFSKLMELQESYEKCIYSKHRELHASSWQAFWNVLVSSWQALKSLGKLGSFLQALRKSFASSLQAFIMRILNESVPSSIYPKMTKPNWACTDWLQHLLCFFFGSVRSSRNANVHLFVCLV